MASNDCFSAHNYRARNNVPGHCTNATQRAFLKDRLHTQCIPSGSLIWPRLPYFVRNSTGLNQMMSSRQKTTRHACMSSNTGRQGMDNQQVGSKETTP